MKLESVIRARSIWLFHTNDLNPKGLSLANLLSAVAERYKFVSVPTPKEALEATQGNHLRQGVFKKQDGAEVLAELIFYRDGIIADTRSSTDDSDLFLSDLIGWAVSTFGLRPISEIKVRKLYTNEVFVSCDRSLDRLNPTMRRFADKLSNYLDGRGSPHFELSHIQLSVNPLSAPNQPAAFKFELAEPREENRYYSFAPLKTADHMNLLKDLYDILK